MAETKLWFVKVGFNDKQFIAYGADRNQLPTYEVIQDGKAHRKTVMTYPSLLKFLQFIPDMTNPRKVTPSWIKRRYGSSFVKTPPKELAGE